MRTFSALTEAHRQRRDVHWIPLVTLKLWRNRFGDAPASQMLRLSTRTRYLPLATIQDPLEDDGVLAGAWTLPFAGAPTVAAGQVHATATDTFEGAIQSAGVAEAFGAVLVSPSSAWSDSVDREVGLVLASTVGATAYYWLGLHYDGTHHVEIRKWSGTFTVLASVATGPWNAGQRLYAEARRMGAGTVLRVRAHGPAGPILAEVMDPSPLGNTYAGFTVQVASGGGSVLDLRLARPVCGPLRSEWLGHVVSLGPVGDALDASQPETAPASTDLELLDERPLAVDDVTVARFSALFREGGNTGGFDPGGADVRVVWLPDGGIVGDVDPVDDVLIFRGTVEDPEWSTA